MIEKAVELATSYHQGQNYGRYPFLYHLCCVSSKVAKYGEYYQVVAILHDIIEDTEIPLDIIKDEFGLPILDAIKLCSYDMRLKSKSERVLEFYDRWSKVNRAGYYNTDTIIACANCVKVADRLSNVEHCLWWYNGKKLEYYLDEMEEFQASLYIPGNAVEFWLELDRIKMKHG